MNIFAQKNWFKLFIEKIICWKTASSHQSLLQSKKKKILFFFLSKVNYSKKTKPNANNVNITDDNDINMWKNIVKLNPQQQLTLKLAQLATQQIQLLQDRAAAMSLRINRPPRPHVLILLQRPPQPGMRRHLRGPPKVVWKIKMVSADCVLCFICNNLWRQV